MALSEAARNRIHSLVTQKRVVLFMKGSPQAPMCGFSAKAVGALSSLGTDYAHIDVLSDEEVRQGIKEYGNWPTIPQLYVDGELIGGSDIILGMLNTGELHETLGLEKPSLEPPEISISDRAAEEIRKSTSEYPDAALQFRIDANWDAQFALEASTGNEIKAEANGIVLYMDLATAQRANGLTIDWAETLQGSGLTIHNPNAPPPVKHLEVSALKEALDSQQVVLVDVRTEQERQQASIEGAVVLDMDGLAHLETLPKDTPLAFLCHHGNSSLGAAEHFRKQGYTEVFNVSGGIDAWSREIDSAVPRY